MDEGKILKRLKAGDEQALGWFIDRYTAYVSTIVHSVIGAAMDKADVEEVTADVFLALWQGREKLEPGKCKAYLSALARNTALNKLRQRHQELPLEDDRITIAIGAPSRHTPGKNWPHWYGKAYWPSPGSSLYRNPMSDGSMADTEDMQTCHQEWYIGDHILLGNGSDIGPHGTLFTSEGLYIDFDSLPEKAQNRDELQIVLKIRTYIYDPTENDPQTYSTAEECISFTIPNTAK